MAKSVARDRSSTLQDEIVFVEVTRKIKTKKCVEFRSSGVGVGGKAGTFANTQMSRTRKARAATTTTTTTTNSYTDT